MLHNFRKKLHNSHFHDNKLTFREMIPENAIPEDRIIYVAHDAAWKVEWKGIFDVFLDKKFALKFAYELRDKLDSGEVLQIKVEGANGIMEIVWTFTFVD